MRAVLALALLAMAPGADARELSFDQRVAAQTAIEQVLWSHRIWPSENPGSKPPLSAVMSEAAIEAKVEKYLAESSWVTAPQLQAEMDRMTRDTRDPEVLRELFEALGNDPLVIAETLARASLASSSPSVASEAVLVDASRPFELPAVHLTGCTNDTWTRTKLDLPDPRTQATAVWTGSEMLIWGGSDGAGGNFHSGGRYDPATDTWAAISTGTNAPSHRIEHTAIWTGTEMIVWGGSFTNTGGRYNPTTDTWTATSTGTGVPEARGSHTAVWTGTEMIVWGGLSGDFLNTGGKYNPSTNAWTATSIGANVPFGRYGHSAVWTGTEMIVWAGQANGATQNSGGRYNASTNTWTPTNFATAPGPRLWHGAVWTGSVMIVWGGSDTGGNGVNSGGRYTPSTDSWASTSVGANVPTPRARHSVVWTGTEMIVWGSGVNTGGRYNPSSDTWVPTSTAGAVPSGMSDHVAAWTGTEMLVWAGRDGTGNLVNTGSRYNPADDTWVAMTTGSYTPRLRVSPTAVWTGAEMIVWGGMTFGASAVYNTGARYLPSTDTWVATSTGANVPAGRSGHTAVWTGTEMIVWGGHNANFSNLNSGGRYDPATDAWVATSTAPGVPATRSSHAGVWTGTQMVVWGGYGGAGRLNSGGRYDPATNTWTATSTGANVPSARGDPSRVWTGTEMIVWGGNDNFGQLVNTGGRYNPTTDTWIPTSTGANVPAARYGPPAVWTGTEMIVWGGWNGTAALATGGRYNPSTNTWLTTSTGAGVPSARTGHTAVWTGTEMVVWGGDAYDGVRDNYVNTGSRYNPASNTWTPTSIAGAVPPGRSGHGAVFTGTEMIVWGGNPHTATGGRYCACPSGQIVYRDADGDGYGNPAVTTSTCEGTVPPGYVIDATDCNDGDTLIHPGASEAAADGIDQDCDGGDLCYEDGDLDGFGTAATVGSVDLDCGDPGESVLTTDCNDADPAVHPGASDSCNGLDDDCSGTTDTGGDTLCNDANPCTNDTCNGIGGCGHVDNADPCDDGDACTTGDACAGGSCGGAPLGCDDGNPCTEDTCNPGSGCVHTNNTSSCDDGDLCTTSDLCGGGACTGTPVACDDGNVCTDDACNPATGLCQFTGGTCVVGVEPPNDTVDVGVSSNVTLTYLEPIQPATVNASTFRLIGPDEAAVPATYFVDPSATRATLDPVGTLLPDTTYRVETTSGILGPGSVPTRPFNSFLRTGAGAAFIEIPTVSQPSDPLPTQARGGAAIAKVGDLDEDGVQDQVSGAPGFLVDAAFAGTAVVEAGAVFIYLGSAEATERGQPDIIFEGVDAHDRAGVSVAGGFDFNGDGRPDIVIGAEQVDRTTDPDNPTPSGAGKVYLIFFDPTDAVHYPNLDDPAIPDVVSLSLVGQPGGVPGVVFSGVALGDQAGFSVDGGGTFTEGGGTDIVIGAPGADPGGRTDAGAVYVVFDSTTLSGTVSLSQISSGQPNQIPGKAYLGASAGDNLGFSTAFAGATVQGFTATSSLAMGAPGTQDGTGTVVVAPRDPDTTPIIVDSIGTTEPGFVIEGSQTDERLGFAVDDGGDALADGSSDLLLGAPTYDAGVETDAGRVLQTSQTFPTGIYSADDVGTTISGVVWTGDATGDQLGFAVAGVSDVTGDGFDDIVLGAPFFDPVVEEVPQADAGAVYVIEGAPATGSLGTQSVEEVGTTVAGQVLTGTQAGEHTGSSITGTEDFSGDGESDFSVGAPDRDADSGTVYTVLNLAPPPVGQCGPAGCQVADLATGAQVDVPAGALASEVILGAEGIVSAGALPAPVPDGKMLYGAASFTPDGQTFASPFATIVIPTVSAGGFSFAPAEVLPLFYFNGTGWAAAGIAGTTGPNPSHPSLTAVIATADVLHVYAVFLNDADGDAVRDESDNCPTVPNPSQLDTDADLLGDACECLNVDCADANPCTDDLCASTTGSCYHTNNAAPCQDGDPCTAGDMCDGGACQTGSAITPPPEALGLTASADKETFTWSAALHATGYDVVRGSTAGLPVGPGGGDEICFAALGSASLVDGSIPAVGTAYWYLARGINTCGVGTYGLQSDAVPRVTSTCP